MTSISSSNPSGLEQKLQQALNGVQSALPAGSKLTVGGSSSTQAQIVAALQKFVDEYDAVTTAKHTLAQAVSARVTDAPNAREYLAQLKGALVGLFGRNSPSLAQFGFTAKLPTKQTGQTQVLAAAKRAETRTLRGTLGSAQKAAIKATGVTQVSVGPDGVKVTPPETAPAAGGGSTAGAGSSTPAPTPNAPAPVAAEPAAPQAPAAPVAPKPTQA